jgi:hypothetical protein
MYLFCKTLFFAFLGKIFISKYIHDPINGMWGITVWYNELKRIIFSRSIILAFD